MYKNAVWDVKDFWTYVWYEKRVLYGIIVIILPWNQIESGQEMWAI